MEDEKSQVPMGNDADRGLSAELNLEIVTCKVTEESSDEPKQEDTCEGQSEDDVESSNVPKGLETLDGGKVEELSSTLSAISISSSATETAPLVVSSGEKPDETDQTAMKHTHHLKWIEWKGKKTAVVTQNENGPCPLIAIANILLLRGKISLPANVKQTTASDLLQYIGEAITDSVPTGLAGSSVLNYEQNMHDAIAVLPHLPTGLDVNVKFTGVRHFEYTPECIIFDLLNIPLYHGWLVDPQSHETVAALGNLGYNQIVERIIVNKVSSDENLVTEALIAEEFLERTATQLTYHGICELHSAMKQEELGVLFRNNHFSTILKRKNELFLLVTDQGFLHEPRVVWETLCNIDGDGQFVDSKFLTVAPMVPESYSHVPDLNEDQQISHDYLVALSLQEDQKKIQQNKEQTWEELKQAVPVAEDITDEEFARKLQDDDLQAEQSSSSPNRRFSARQRSRKGVCSVL